MHPVVKTIILIASIATFIPVIINIVKDFLEIRKINRECLGEMDEEIKRFLADPKNYKAKQMDN